MGDELFCPVFFTLKQFCSVLCYRLNFVGILQHFQWRS